MQRIICPEGEYSEGAVRLVACRTAHRLPPEVIAEELGNPRRGSYVRIVPDCKYIVVYQAALQTVPVTPCREDTRNNCTDGWGGKRVPYHRWKGRVEYSAAARWRSHVEYQEAGLKF